jgi:hypothetical protein
MQPMNMNDIRGRVYRDLKKSSCALTYFGRTIALKAELLYLQYRDDIY